MEGANNQRKENSKWLIKIAGDKRYIENLKEVLSGIDCGFEIYEEGESFYLKGKIFDDTTNPKEISTKAKTILTLMPVLPPLKSERKVEPLEIEEIKEFIIDNGREERTYSSDGVLGCSVKISDNGKRSITVCPETINIKITGNPVNLMRIGKNGEIIDDFVSIEEIRNYIDKIKNDSLKLSNLNKYLQQRTQVLTKYASNCWNDNRNREILVGLKIYDGDLELAKWAVLRKIYETIRDGVEGIDKLRGKNWVSNPQLLNDFYYTASNQYLHPKEESTENNYRKIDLQEARQILLTLLSKYIEEKTRNQGEIR